MKKLLGASLSVALVYGSMAPAQAELLKNLQTSGEVEVHAVVSNNLTDFTNSPKDKDGRAHSRVIVNLGFDLNEDASAMVTLGKTSANRTYGSAAQTGTGVQTEILVDQAYLGLKNVLGLDHRLGRQFYGNPGDLLVYYGPSRGPAVRTLPITAVDALTTWFQAGENNHLKGNVIIGKLTDNTGVSPETDTDIRGVEVACDKYENMKLEGRLYDIFKHAGGGKGHLYTISPRVTGKMMDGNVGYSAEMSINTGNNPGAATCTGECKASGTAFLVGGNYSMPFMGKLKIMGEFGLGSGDEAAGDTKDKMARFPASDYRPGDIWGGNIGALGTGVVAGGINAAGLSGLTIFNVGAWHDTEKYPKLGWGVHFYDFSATKKGNSATGKKHIGSEIDLRAKWQHSDKVTLSAGYGVFNADASGADPVTQYGANVHVAF